MTPKTGWKNPLLSIPPHPFFSNLQHKHPECTPSQSTISLPVYPCMTNSHKSNKCNNSNKSACLQCDGEHKRGHQGTALAQGDLPLWYRPQVCRPAVGQEHQVDQRFCSVLQQPAGGQHRPLHLPDVSPSHPAQQRPTGLSVCMCVTSKHAVICPYACAPPQTSCDLSYECLLQACVYSIRLAVICPCVCRCHLRTAAICLFVCHIYAMAELSS